jgi:hypothetical protein
LSLAVCHYTTGVHFKSVNSWDLYLNEVCSKVLSLVNLHKSKPPKEGNKNIESQ